MSSSKARKLEQNPRFPVLDTLRALGALAVLTTHVAFQTGDYFGHGVFGTVLARLDIGVAIFFVLSGFLLSRPYLARATASHSRPATGQYYWKRFLRIYPVYGVTVVLALTLIPENDGVGVRGWLRTLLLANVYTNNQFHHGLTQMWSLAVEASFYLVLPPLMLVVLGRGNRRFRPVRMVALLFAMVILSCSWHLGLASVVADMAPGAPLLWLPAFLTWFAVGMGLALAHVLHQSRKRPNGALRLLTTLGSMPGACWCLVVGLLLVAATPVGGPTQLLVATSGESTAKHLLYALIGGLVVVTGIFPEPGSLYSRAMSVRPLRHIGLVSYSIFCIHLPILSLVMAVTGSELFNANGLQVWALTVVLSLPAAELLYRVIEKPGMRLRNRVGRNSASLHQPKRAPQTTTTR